MPAMTVAVCLDRRRHDVAAFHLGDSMPPVIRQVLAEMIIFNESRLGGSRVLATYSKPRTCSTRLSLRYQASLRRHDAVKLSRDHYVFATTPSSPDPAVRYDSSLTHAVSDELLS